MIKRLRNSASGPLARAFGANSIAFGATLFIQIVTVPLFLSTVGIQKYGDWVVLTAIPSYLSLTDLGFASAAATAATHALAKSGKRGATEALSSAWASVTAVSFSVLVLLAIALYYFLPIDEFPTLGNRARVLVVIQLVWVAVWMQIGFTEAAMRAAGKYARGLNYLTAIRLAELVSQALALFIWHDLLAAGLAMLACRVVGGVIVHLAVRRQLDWFRLSIRFASSASARRLLGPSLSFAGFTYGYALLNQGFVIVIGRGIGNGAAVIFTSVRTMTNAIQQVSNIPIVGALPELTIAYARDDFARARRIQRVSLLSALGVGTLCALVIGSAGPQIVGYWSGGKIHPSYLFVILMVLTTVADIPWQVYANVLRSTSRHQLTSVVYLMTCAVCVAIGALALPSTSLVAVPVILFLLDIVITPIAVRQSLSANSKHFGHDRPEVSGLDPLTEFSS